MSVWRSIFLAASQSRWLRESAPKYWFVRRTADRFMPGETLADALAAAAALKKDAIGALLTCLGENISERAEAEASARHYTEALDRVQAAGLDAEISVKLTQLGLDVDRALCAANLERVIERAGAKSLVWIDMESSNYVDATLAIYRRARERFPNVGVCLQAYLYRTAKDLSSLTPLGASIRLVKGAYHEPSRLAFPRKRDVNENYFILAKMLLGADGQRTALATHDANLLDRIASYAESQGIEKSAFEIEMLYGIRRDAQLRLARAGYNVRVLISYGSYWFPWFMRRLAERPANALFLIRNLI